MKRRSAVGVLAGLALGWAGASLFADGSDDGAGDEGTPTAPATTAPPSPGQTGSATATPTPSPTARSTTETPAPSGSPSPPAASTSTGAPTDATATTSTATAAGTPAAQRRKVETTFKRGGSDPGERFTILYTLRNRHTFRVRARFRLSITPRDGPTRRTALTVELDPGGVANDSYTFEDHGSSVTAWSASLVSVERV